MNKEVSTIIDFWKQEYCEHIAEYVRFEISHQLQQMAALFSPGKFYYYILNFHNLSLDYVHPGTKEVLGIDSEDFDMQKLLSMLPESELKGIEKKEKLASDFLSNYLEPQQLPFYKVIYFFRVKDAEGNLRTMLHQATTLKVSDNGKVEHVLGIQTDVSHLNMIKHDFVSFMSLNDEPSFYNLDPENGIFDPDASLGQSSLHDLLTKREKEVVRQIASGLSGKEIAGHLHISFNTVRSHKKNILQKSQCNNVAELVAKCLVEGVI